MPADSSNIVSTLQHCCREAFGVIIHPTHTPVLEVCSHRWCVLLPVSLVLPLLLCSVAFAVCPAVTGVAVPNYIQLMHH